MVKLNISFPNRGTYVSVVVDDETKMVPFYDKRMGQEVSADSLGPTWTGYTLKLTGGNDKQGFPMMQGVLLKRRARLLVDNSYKCYRARKTGERRRKSIRGCIAGPDLSAMSFIVVKRGPAEIPGLTDKRVPRRLGPKRATRIRKMFDLPKDADVLPHRVSRTFTSATGKQRTKRPVVQRLITSTRLARKQRVTAAKKTRYEKNKAQLAEYQVILKAVKAARNAKHHQHSK